MSVKADFKQKSIKSYKEGHYIRGNIQQEDIMILNIYAPNLYTPKFIKQTLLSIKEQRGPETIIVGDLKTVLSSIDKTYRQKNSQR
jgi:hypothetical protein